MTETTTTSNDTATPPTRDASDVYDRQIRLWGAEAQVSHALRCKAMKCCF